jgi:hypothetical protein
VCTQPFQPGVNPATFALDYSAAGAALAHSIATARRVAAEPPLRCYVYADCPLPAQAVKGERRTATKHRAKHRKKRHAHKRWHRRHRRR